VASADVERTPFTSSATWFNRNAFAQPAPGTFGVQERNALRNPGFWNWDVGIRKNFPVRDEIQRLQFRLEIFNLLNHPNWGEANANPRSGFFGHVTSKFGQRQLQLALKYIFWALLKSHKIWKQSASTQHMSELGSTPIRPRGCERHSVARLLTIVH